MAAPMCSSSLLARKKLLIPVFKRDFCRVGSALWSRGQRDDSRLCYGHPRQALVCKRTIFGWRRRRDTDYFYRVDKMDKKYELVYKCRSLDYAIASVIVTALGAVPTAFQTYRFIFDIQFTSSLNQLVSDGVVVQSAGDLGLLLGSYWLFTLSIFLFTRVYPLRIYHDEKAKRFVLVYQSMVPFRRFKGDCEEGEARPPTLDLLYRFSLYRLKNRYVYLDEIAFRIPAHFNLMLGHVKGKQ